MILSKSPATEDADSALDETDLAILQALAKNARITLSKMSEDIGMRDATISHRLKRSSERWSRVTQ